MWAIAVVALFLPKFQFISHFCFLHLIWNRSLCFILLPLVLPVLRFVSALLLVCRAQLRAEEQRPTHKVASANHKRKKYFYHVLVHDLHFPARFPSVPLILERIWDFNAKAAKPEKLTRSLARPRGGRYGGDATWRART